jgi:hypothetical protein
MPFKSEAQRKYLWANEPNIARDWADTYGSRIQKENGGIMRLGFQNGNDVDDPWLWGKMKKGKNYLQDTITGGITNLLDNTILGRIAAMNDATNRRAWNYNPALQGQIDFMKDQGMYGVMDQSGLNKITSGALAGKNLQSLFGSNDLMAMYDKELARATGVLENLPEQWSKLAASTDEEDIAAYKKKVAWHRDRVEKIKAEQAAAAAFQQQSAADALAAQRQGTRAADTAAGAFREDIQLDPRGGSGPGPGTWHGQTAAKERQGVQVAGPGGGKGAYFADGGLINFYKNGGFIG